MTDSNRKNEGGMADVQQTMAAIEAVVRILGPLETDERQRVLQGVLVILRESLPTSGGVDFDRSSGSNLESNVPNRARLWMRQNNLKDEQLSQVFDLSDGVATIIASGVSGKNNSEKTIKAYVLAGVAGFLSSGEPTFDDKTARLLCETLGCYDNTNHSKYMKDKGNNFVGDKDKGWKLTAPGLKNGAVIVKELSGMVDA
jgi:hypothetical protein